MGKGQEAPHALTVSMWPTSCGVGEMETGRGRADCGLAETDGHSGTGSPGVCVSHCHNGEEGVSTLLAQSLGLLFPALY